MANKQDLIGYCGLYCGDCVGHTETVANLTRDLRKELRRHRFDKMAEMMAKVPYFKEFENYDKCYSLLGTMVKLRCKRACRGNGGPPNCKIRSCSRKKKLDSCWQCENFSTCENLKFLETNHGVAHLKNLRKLKRHGPAAFVKGKKLWYEAK
ncbi:MAG: hypothetical protein A2Z25_14340 [Planctomycetes bacterium RBG_16_55_9]|nr:MAG: hypothetical protein A2Z25_14340 [Planctomycetes bacterium RBG_16_55_9]